MIRSDFEDELRASRAAESEARWNDAFAHLERAHVLGQPITRSHVRVHALMFRWGWRRRDVRECAGQLFRIAGAATKTAFGLVPEGNTGGSDVSPFRRMPFAPDIADKIRRARAGGDRA